MRTLILGYGNQDRQDDGVAWHVLEDLQKKIEYPDHLQIDETFDSKSDLVLVFQLQLTPEMAEDLSCFDRICFIDAHTGAILDDIHCEQLEPEYQHSPLTHHLTASSLLSILHTIYQKKPEAILVSVKAMGFGFSTELSPQTADLVPKASQIILNWISQY